MKHRIGATVIGLALLLASVGASAQAAQPSEAAAPRTEARAWLGTRSQFPSGLFTGLPANLSGDAAVDFKAPVRVELQLVGGFLKSFQATLSAGVPFRLYDGRKTGRSRLELKLPLQVAFSHLRATWEADDGYDDKVRWLLLGPTLDLDFTWWVRPSLGVCLKLGGSYLFRIADTGSEYGGDNDDPTHSLVHDKLGVGEVVLSLGVAFG